MQHNVKAVMNTYNLEATTDRLFTVYYSNKQVCVCVCVCKPSKTINVTHLQVCNWTKYLCIA